MSFALPPRMRVVVRDWFDANHILFFGPHENVLVDTGHVAHAEATEALLRRHLGGAPLHRILNTHCHSDHMGGNATLRRAFGSTVAIPAGAAPRIRAWDTEALWLDHAGQRAEPFEFEGTLAAGDRLDLGELAWEVLPAPGHDMDALMFWCEAERLLVSGDALWENGFGIVLPGEGWRERLEAAHDTLAHIGRLSPRLVIPGHGEPFTCVSAALERSRARVALGLESEERLARYVLEVMLVYWLLERGGEAETTVAERVPGIPMFRDYATRYFSVDAGTLVSALVGRLVSRGVVRREAGRLLP